MAAKSKQVKHESWLEKNHPEWYPLPPGVFTAGMFGLVALFYIVYTVVQEEWGWLIVALILGAIAVHEIGSAAYTAGLRRWAHAESLRATRSGISAGREGVHQEDAETPEE